MINEILIAIEEFKDLKLVSGPRFRKDPDSKNESGTIVRVGNVYYDCQLECKGKSFPISFTENDNFRNEIIEI